MPAATAFDFFNGKPSRWGSTSFLQVAR